MSSEGAGFLQAGCLSTEGCDCILTSRAEATVPFARLVASVVRVRVSDRLVASVVRDSVESHFPKQRC